MTGAPRHHAEVASALEAIGSPSFGAHIAESLGSQLQFFGIRVPALRARVKQGFSFYQLSEREILGVWDRLWRFTPHGDVMSAALEYYRPLVRGSVSADFWPVVRGWSERADNWAHADTLSGVYSWVLAHHHDAVYPQLEGWSSDQDQWLRRMSIVSLIHYSGKNAVFMPLDEVLALVSNCLDDHRYYMTRAVGWVLREMGHVYPLEVRSYLEAHAAELAAPAFTRAIERRTPDERVELRGIRDTALRARGS